MKRFIIALAFARTPLCRLSRKTITAQMPK